jgi:hypothetical protein
MKISSVLVPKQFCRNLSYARSGIDSKRSSIVIVIAAFKLR